MSKLLIDDQELAGILPRDRTIRSGLAYANYVCNRSDTNCRGTRLVHIRWNIGAGRYLACPECCDVYSRVGGEFLASYTRSQLEGSSTYVSA